MTPDQLKGFVLKAKEDGELRTMLRKTNSPDDVVALAAAAGFRLSVQLLDETYLELSKEELSNVVVRRAGFRLQPYGKRHWFGWK